MVARSSEISTLIAKKTLAKVLREAFFEVREGAVDVDARLFPEMGLSGSWDMEKVAEFILRHEFLNANR